MRVHFEEVGRMKQSWTAEVESLSYASLFKQVKPHLRSHDIDFLFSDDGMTGTIAAGFHKVGRFRIEGAVQGPTVEFRS